MKVQQNKEAIECLKFVVAEMRNTAENATIIDSASMEAKLKQLQSLIHVHANDLTDLIRDLEA